MNPVQNQIAEEPAIFAILANNFQNLNPQTKNAAEQAIKGFKGFLKNTFINMLKQGRALNELLAKMQQQLGKSDGKVTFLWWLNSEEWQHTQTLARSLMNIAKKFDKLPSTLKNELRDKLNGWSLSAIKELLSAGRDVINKLKHRPTSAVEVRKAKQQALLLERPLTEDVWQELEEDYGLGECLEMVKEETAKIASQENHFPKYKDALLVLRQFGINSVSKPQKITAKKAPIISEVIVELAKLAIRNSELKEALASAPEQLADSIISQIKSNETRIKQLRIKYADPQELFNSSSDNKNAEKIEERLVVLNEQNEKLEQKNKELERKLDDLEDTYKNTLVRLEKRIKEKEELAEENRTLVRKISDLNMATSGKDALIETLLQLERIKTLDKPEVGMEVIVTKGKELGISGIIKEYLDGKYRIEIRRGERSKTFFKKVEEFLIL